VLFALCLCFAKARFPGSYGEAVVWWHPRTLTLLGVHALSGVRAWRSSQTDSGLPWLSC
jgi:hypothetical protein